MKLLTRTLAAVVFLLATAALLLSVAGAVGVWIVKEPATTRATKVFGKIDAALSLADQKLQHLKTSFARAAERLESARKEQEKIPPQNNAARRLVARTALATMAPDLNNAHQTLQTVAEAAVVVNSVLEDVGNLPMLSTSGLDVDSLTQMNTTLAGVGPAAWNLSRLLGEPDADDADTQLSRIDQTLKSMKGLMTTYES